MKELSIEQKAQRYDEAIERAKNTIEVNKTIPDIVECVESLFPELAESEDERIRKWLIYYFKEVCDNVSEKEKKGVLAWLEKQSDTQKKIDHAYAKGLSDAKKALEKQDEQKSAWNEKDEEMYKKVETAIDSYYAPFSRDTEEMSEWFKSLKDRVQPKQEWSKEDEEKMRSIFLGIEAYCPSIIYGKSKEEILNWFRFLSHQNKWIPSDEQMEALHYVTNFDYGGHKAMLVSLYEQLKKLRGE